MVHIPNSARCIIIYGATASGKSAKAVEIATQLNCKSIIINADSMQVYKEIPIITAQPLPSILDLIPHHMYGVISCNEANFSVAKWLKMTSKAIYDAIAKDIMPIVVGGTGMYLNALMNGLSDIPEVPLEIYSKIKNEIESNGITIMYEKLISLDPRTKILKNDSQRLVRALGVFEHTGKTMSEWHDENKKYFDSNLATKILIKPPRDELYRRINDRFILMIEGGAVEEVEKLLIKCPAINYPKAIGLYQIIDYISGTISKGELIAKVQQLTRNYAKRQETWFST